LPTTKTKEDDTKYYTGLLKPIKDNPEKKEYYLNQILYIKTLAKPADHFLSDQLIPLNTEETTKTAIWPNADNLPRQIEYESEIYRTDQVLYKVIKYYETSLNFQMLKVFFIMRFFFRCKRKKY
jgi:hypothetical protein